MNPSLQTALALHKANRVRESLAHYAAALVAAPNDSASLYYGGVAAWQAGEFETALLRIDQLIALTPSPPADAFYHRALIHASLSQNELAAADYERTIAINPRFAAALNNLGELRRKQAQFDTAEALFARALSIDPALHAARLNRGLNAQQRGDLSLARTELAECVKREPDNVRARAALTDVLLDLSLQTDALMLARAGVKRIPASAELWNALGQAEQAAGNIDAARVAYAHGRERDAANVPLALNAAHLENENAAFAAARGIYQSIVDPAWRNGAQFRSATLLPAIPASEADIDQLRSQFASNLQVLQTHEATLSDPLNEFGDTPFYLSYHGREDDAALLQLLSNTLRRAAPSLSFRASHVDTPQRAQKWRVGFCSQFLFDQSVGRSIHAYVNSLPRDAFDVFILRVPPFFNDALAQSIDANSDVHRLPWDLAAARARIAALQLDALIFPEIGMDSFTYFLAHARLAPLQWTTLGHPCTSGLDTIDGYLSYASLETENSERFYSESLVKIAAGAIYPDYPVVALPKAFRTRAQLGFREHAPLLICPQSLFKLMPQFDLAISSILQRLPNATLLLPASKMPGQTHALQQRFATTLGEYSSRVQFFPRRSRAEFVELVNACDVVLDPFPVGGGITTWDALAAGTPIITLPNALMRSRFAGSALSEIGAFQCIASNVSDYVDRVCEIVENAELQQMLKRTIRERSSDVYRDQRAVAHFIAALTRALELR